MAKEVYLPYDLLLKVFSYLCHADLSRAAVVCKQWGAASEREQCLRCLNFENRQIPEERIPDVYWQHRDAFSINLTGASPLELLVEKATLRLSKLVILTLGRGKLDRTFFQALSEFTRLRILNVVDATLGSDTCMYMSHGRLLTLKLVRCNVMAVTVRLPMLTVLKLENCVGITSVFLDGISRSDRLEVLELDGCSQLLSASLVLPRLKRMRLLCCCEFAGLTLRAPMLSSITVSDCPASNSSQKLALQKETKMTMEGLQCQSLQEVDLTDCKSLTDSICKVFSDGGGCPMLKSLILDNCESLPSARFCSSYLQNLSLAGCCELTVLELDCPALQRLCSDDCLRLERASLCTVGLPSLDIGMCAKLSTLVISAPEMEELGLKACKALSVVSIDCPRLKSLDASYCSQLKDETLAAIAASCPQIETLLLTSCESIGPDGLRSLRLLPRLTTLDLSYTSLTDLLPVFESCSQLKVLKLQACKRLTDSSLEPLYKQAALPLLQELDLSFCSVQLACEILLVEPMNKRPEQTLTLNCVSSTNIRKVLIPLPLAHCFVNLSSLNLSLSTNLKEVDISCLTLRFLNLSNCPSLTILKLDCPSLISLLLMSCNIDEETLEAAVSQCAAVLETLDIRSCPKILAVSEERVRTVYPRLKLIMNRLQPPRFNRLSSIQRHMRAWYDV